MNDSALRRMTVNGERVIPPKKKILIDFSKPKKDLPPFRKFVESLSKKDASTDRAESPTPEFENICPVLGSRFMSKRFSQPNLSERSVFTQKRQSQPLPSQNS